jgi:hypothetical protein
MFSDLHHYVYLALAEVIQVKVLVSLICIPVLWIFIIRFSLAFPFVIAADALTHDLEKILSVQSVAIDLFQFVASKQ